MTAAAERKVKLKIENLSLSIGGVKALDNFSLDIYDNEILAIVGPDSAGKTGILDCISGFSKPRSGQIHLEGENCTGISPSKAVQLGIARTFKDTELFTGLTVLDNLMAARHILVDQNLLTGALYYGPAQGEETDHRRAVEEIINFLEMEAIRNSNVVALTYVQRKKVELAKALATEPEVLLLDEMFAGLNLQEKADFTGFISDIFKGQGDAYPRTPVLRDGIKCIVLFEQELDAVKGIAERVIMLDSGKKTAITPA